MKTNANGGTIGAKGAGLLRGGPPPPLGSLVESISNIRIADIEEAIRQPSIDAIPIAVDIDDDVVKGGSRTARPH